MKNVWIALLTTLTLYGVEPLVNADWLQSHLEEKDLVVVDVSDAQLYQQGHIPGSFNAPISLWREKHGDYLLVKKADEIQKLFERLGIDAESKVVVYSHHDNAKDILKATYVLWVMEYYGVKKTALLDGGMVAWKAVKAPLTTKVPRQKKGTLKAKPNPALVADLARVKEEIGKSQMIDARPSVFYFGAKKQGVLQKAGHIPGAKSYFWQYSFEGDYLKKPKVLKEMLVEGLGFDPKKPMITYCTGGLETSMNFFVLHRLLGFEKIRLYDASMREWGNRTDTPMQVYRWE